MVAPAGVNEEIPREPAKAGLARAEPQRGNRAAPEGELATDAAPGEADLAETELVEAGQRGGGTRTGGTRTRRNPHEAEPAQAEPARGGTGLAEAGPADAELAGTAELAGPGEPGLDAAEERRDVSPLAVAGIILGILALVGAAVGVLAVITHGFRPKTVITYRPAAVFGLRPGECINSAGTASTFTVLSCATPARRRSVRYLQPAGRGPGPAPRRYSKTRVTAAPAGSAAT